MVATRDELEDEKHWAAKRPTSAAHDTLWEELSEDLKELASKSEHGRALPDTELDFLRGTSSSRGRGVFVCLDRILRHMRSSPATRNQNP